MSPPGSSPRNPIRLPAGLRFLAGVEFGRKIGLCEMIFGAALARNGICWVRTAPGPIWKLDLGNPTHRWIVYGSYEGPSLWRWLKAHAASVNTVVDSGANIGQTVLYFATYLPEARIFAYEPGRNARLWLEEGVAANEFSRVTVVPKGLSNQAGSSRLASEGGSELHGAWNKVNPSEGEAIELVALDAEIERLGIAQVDLWKLDVEGHELEALKGADRSLAARRIRAISLELGDAKSESADFLKRHGYNGWDLGNSGRPKPLGKHTPWGNALFLPPS